MDPPVATGLTGLNGGPASVRAAHSVNLQAQIRSVRHVVRPHVILREYGGRACLMHNGSWSTMK